MKRAIIILTALIAITATAQQREFFGCKFGDPFSTVLTRLTVGGYNFDTKGAKFSVWDVTFAGIQFYKASMEASPNFSMITFIYMEKDYRAKYLETATRLSKKYGDGIETETEEGTITKWEDEGISCMFLVPSKKHNGGMVLIYKDPNYSPDDEL